MAGIIKVNQYQDFNGNTLFTSDGNGNLTTQKTNYPAFQITLGSTQTIADASTTKVEFDTEDFDTDNAFDVSAYKFTVPTGKAGKYFLSSGGEIFDNNDLVQARLEIYKNGSAVVIGPTTNVGTGGSEARAPIFVSSILDLAENDYIEIYCNYASADGNGAQLVAGTKRPIFYGYRIGS